MGLARNWTTEEYDYLKDSWGTVSVDTICKKLSRTRSALNIKVQRLGLGSFLENGDYILFNQLIRAVTGSEKSYSYKTTSWVSNRDFPVKYQKVGNERFRIVYISDFWNWAENNKNFLDFSKMQENILGKEPNWVKEQRKRDFQKNIKYISTPWTSVEDERLRYLLKKQKYSYYELSKILHRTCGAIQRRVCDIKIKERPVKADNHNKWNEKELFVLADCIRNGRNYEDISDVIGRSSKAIRGIVFSKYKTEKLDVVRQLLGIND